MKVWLKDLEPLDAQPGKSYISNSSWASRGRDAVGRYMVDWSGFRLNGPSSSPNIYIYPYYNTIIHTHIYIYIQYIDAGLTGSGSH